MSTRGEGQANRGPDAAWRVRVAADLATYAAEQQHLYGGIDEMTLARYEAGVLPPEERSRVEQALRNHTALRECLEIAQALDAEWHVAAASTSTENESKSFPVWLAAAAAVVAIIGFGLAYHYDWRRRAPGGPQRVVKDVPTPSKKPGTIVVNKGEGSIDTILPPFKDALSALEKRSTAGIDPNEFRREYDQLVKDYPDHKAEIESNASLAAALKPPASVVIVKKPEVEPLPPVVKKSVREEILEHYASAPKPLNVNDASIRKMSEEARRFPETDQEIQAIAAASEPTPQNELLYAEARAKELMASPKESAEVRDLRNIVLTLRLRDDTRRQLVLQSKPLVLFMKSKQTDDPTTKVSDMKTQARILADRLAPANKRSPLLFCLLPPGIRGDADDLLRNAQIYARNTANPVDATLNDFQMRARRPSDQLQVIVPTSVYNRDAFNPTSPDGPLNWRTLASAGGKVEIIAVMNHVLNPAQRGDLLDPIGRTVTEVRQASITMLACLDCGTGIKSVADLEAEINAWVSDYGNIQGFFLYNASTDVAGSIYRYIRSIPGPPGLIVFSSAQFPPEDMIRKTDDRFVLSIYQPQITVSEFAPPGWIAKYPPHRFAGVFKSGPAELDASIKIAAAKHLGGIYLSDSPQQLPDYWLNQVDLVQRLNNEILGGMKAANPAAKKKQAARRKLK